MKLAWLTDIHLNCLKYAARFSFYQQILNINPDAILITGDIAEGTNVNSFLCEMRNKLNKPIYFVLGNHDFYGKTIAAVKNEMTELSCDGSLLHWLPAVGPQVLTESVILIGQDGWADGRLGNFYQSTASFYDSRMIPDLTEQKAQGMPQLLDKMQQLAEQDVQQMQQQLIIAIEKKPTKIIILTHVPPFQEAAIHKGKICDDSYLPLFVSKVMGELILSVATENPAIEFLVLCGHTHSAAFFQPLDNLTVKTGKAEYYKPQVETLEF